MAVEVSPQCLTSCSVPESTSGLKGVSFLCHPEQVLPNLALADPYPPPSWMLAFTLKLMLEEDHSEIVNKVAFAGMYSHSGSRNMDKA